MWRARWGCSLDCYRNNVYIIVILLECVAVKMGIKEFRERLSEVTATGGHVVNTNHEKSVASFAPFSRKNPEAVGKAADEIARWQAEMNAEGVGLEEVLADLGLDPWGTPLDATDR